jgi:hypothetical protein
MPFKFTLFYCNFKNVFKLFAKSYSMDFPQPATSDASVPITNRHNEKSMAHYFLFSPIMGYGTTRTG